MAYNPAAYYSSRGAEYGATGVAGRAAGIGDVIKEKAEEVKDEGYYSKLVKTYPEQADEVGYTSRIAEKYPNWRAI